jgi:hypothetical protein
MFTSCLDLDSNDPMEAHLDIYHQFILRVLSLLLALKELIKLLILLLLQAY